MYQVKACMVCDFKDFRFSPNDTCEICNVEKSPLIDFNVKKDLCKKFAMKTIDDLPKCRWAELQSLSLILSSIQDFNTHIFGRSNTSIAIEKFVPDEHVKINMSLLDKEPMEITVVEIELT